MSEREYIMQAQYERLEKERDELREALAIERTNRECWAGEAARYQKISDELQAKLEAVRKKIAGYRHTPDCHSVMSNNLDCNCIFGELRDILAATEGGGDETD